MEDKYYWLALSSIQELRNTSMFKLYDRFGSPERILSASAEELVATANINEELIARIINFNDWDRVKREWGKIKDEGIIFTIFHDDIYPQNLKNIPDPPFFLYIKGEIKQEDQQAIAIVGTRKATNYGRTTAERLSRELTSRGFTIVSGLARGIDSYAHQGALAAGGRTIAILGCGIDIIYPQENKGLMEEIAKSGAVVSEFPFGTRPIHYNFPRRNRIISGLSLGTIVVEATEDSGSLITAHFALEQGREVFAVPGNIFSDKSLGTHKLIKQGAKLVERIEDIIEELRPHITSGRVAEEKSVVKTEVIMKRFNLTEEEDIIYRLLSSEPKHMDEIITETRFPAQRVSTALLSLELKGAARRVAGNNFAREII